MSDIPETPQTVHPHTPADDTEHVYFAGSPLLRAEMGKLLGFCSIGIVIFALPIVWKILSKDHEFPNVYVTLGCFLIGAIVIAFPILRQKTVRYRITNYRIDYERGLLGKSIDTMELWHVEDLEFNQTLFDRIMGTGTITVLSHDDTTPKLVLYGVPKARPLFEELKQRIIAVKRQSGVMKMDIGT